MRRDVPISKQATLWRANGRWFQRRDAAYYAIAKDLLLRKYPRWLDDNDLEEQSGVDGFDCVGDVHAKADGVADWRARRDQRVMLLWDERGQHFDVDRWQKLIRRLARFLMYVDDRRSELIKNTGGMLDPRDALDLEHRVRKICREWAESINTRRA